ncbi:HEAT repeat domain-containing protein [Caldithrix abyssi]|nr:HEAT repeat domain-containing protein [Caldithrix abyssi]
MKTKEEIFQALSNADPRTRLKAIRRLSGMASELALKDRQPIAERISRLLDDKVAFIRWNVAIALGQIGDENALPVLEKMVGDEHANVRFRAALALGLIGS